MKSAVYLNSGNTVLSLKQNVLTPVVLILFSGKTRDLLLLCCPYLLYIKRGNGWVYMVFDRKDVAICNTNKTNVYIIPPNPWQESYREKMINMNNCENRQRQATREKIDRNELIYNDVLI